MTRDWVLRGAFLALFIIGLGLSRGHAEPNPKLAAPPFSLTVEGTASIVLGVPPCGTPEAEKARACLRWTLADCDKVSAQWVEGRRKYPMIYSAQPPITFGCEPYRNGYVAETPK